MSYFDNQTEIPKERITPRHILVVILLFVVIMLPFVGMAYKKRMEEAEKVEAARVAKIQKEQAVRALAAMMHDYPAKEKPVAKIARGTTGQADLQSEGCLPSPGYVWKIMGLEITATDTDPQGWNVSPSGEITVPMNAPLENNLWVEYFSEDESCTEDGGTYSRIHRFDIVCVKITMNATRVK